MSWGVHDATVALGGRRALDAITLEASSGDTVIVAGADGAGKTTLIRLLAGALEPDAGTVRRPDPRRLGFVPAGAGVYPDLTVEENVAFAAQAYGVSGADLARRSELLLSRTELAGARTRLGGQLSGGMRRKLAAVMALLHRPELLLLDEPTTGLDPVSRAELWSILGEAAGEGAAVVASTTYVHEGGRADHVLVLEDGRPLAAGSPGAIVASTPGAVFEAPEPPPGSRSWRRGRGWRAWSPTGADLPSARRVDVDLEDAVIVAALVARDEPEAVR